MDVDSHEVPDVYKCEECSPRFLNMTKAEARLQQLRALAQESQEMEQSHQKKAGVQSKKNVHVGFWTFMLVFTCKRLLKS